MAAPLVGALLLSCTSSGGTNPQGGGGGSTGGSGPQTGTGGISTGGSGASTTSGAGGTTGASGGTTGSSGGSTGSSGGSTGSSGGSTGDGGSGTGSGGTAGSGGSVRVFPTQACLDKASALLAMMTGDEKIAQLQQIERANVSAPDITTYGVGSVYSQGGSAPRPTPHGLGGHD